MRGSCGTMRSQRVAACVATATRQWSPARLVPQPSRSNLRPPQCKLHRLRAIRSDDDIEPVPPARLSALGSQDELAEESLWVAGMMTCWLDEEWPAAELVPVHAELGAAVGRAYTRVRQREGVEEMGDLVLELAGELLPYDFAPTFTDAFSCANKVVELLMLRDDVDVCCTTESDRSAIARYEAQLAAAAAGQEGVS